MLKGVGRVYYRQHIQQAAIGFLTCYSIACGAIQSAFRTKSSAAALDASTPKSSAIHRDAENSLPHPHPGTTSRRSRKRSIIKPGDIEMKVATKNGRKPAHPAHMLPHFPPELAQMIDNLFAKKSNTSMLKYLHSSSLSEHFVDRAKATKLAEAMVHTLFPQRAIQVLQLAHKLHCPLKQNSYQSVAHQLAEAEHWHLILRLVALGKRQTGHTTVRLLNWRTRAIIEATNYMGLESVLDEFEHENLKPNQRTFHLLISGHIRNHNVRLARECMQKMENAGFPADATTHATVVSVYRSLGPAVEVQDHAFEALPDMSDRTSTITLNSLMQLYMDANDMPGILRVLRLFHAGNADIALSDEFGESFIPHGGNGMLDHHAVAIEPHGTLSRPAQTPILPDATTFTILINYMATRRGFAVAVRIFQRMLAVGVKPDAVTAAALLRIHFAAGKEGTAVGIIANMCRAHNVPRSLFNSLGLTSADGTDKLLPHFSNIPLTARIFNTLMRNVLNTRNLKSANTVLQIMRLCKVRPDTKTIEIVMDHLERAELARPRDLIRVLRMLTTTRIPPTLSHVHVIMRSVLRREKFLLQGSGWDVTAAKFSRTRRDLSRFPELFPEGRISSIADSFDPTAGIEFPRKLSYRGLIRPIVQSLSSRRIMSNRMTIALRLKHEAITRSNSTPAKRVFQEMLARGMHPTKRHFAALMEGHALSGDLQGAGNVMDSSLEVGIRPNVVMFTSLIVGHARQGHPGRAMQTFRSMVDAGIRPDVAAVDAIASAYFAVGAYKLARRVLLVLWPLVQAPPKGMESAKLKQLARTFRARNANPDPGDHPKRLTKSERMILRWKIAKLMRNWKRISRPLMNYARWREHR